MSFPETVVLTYGEVKATSLTQRAPLGTRGVLPDGRVFRYSKAGGAIRLAWLVQGEITKNVTGLFSLSSSANLPIGAGTTHTSTWTYMEVETSWLADATALAANTFAEGYLYVGSCADGVFVTSTGTGQMVQIKDHLVHTASSTEHTNFNFMDGDHLVEDVSTDHSVGLYKNPYKDVINVVQAAKPTGPVVGVPLTNVDSGSHFWVQTWGPAVCQAGAAIALGNMVTGSTDAAVTGLGPAIFCSAAPSVAPIIGQALTKSLASQYVIVMLQLSP